MLLLLRRSVVSLLLMVVLTGVVYPLVMTAIGHVVFPHRSQGSLIRSGRHHRRVGADRTAV